MRLAAPDASFAVAAVCGIMRAHRRERVNTVMDLNNGASATFAHGLATAYVGFTVAFGSTMIRWADQRFAHGFGGGPPPSKPPSHGWASVLYEVQLWGLAETKTWEIFSAEYSSDASSRSLMAPHNHRMQLTRQRVTRPACASRAPLCRAADAKRYVSWWRRYQLEAVA